MRYGPAGTWQDVEIDDSQIVWRPNTWPMETNWTALVAREVDRVNGRGFVTEFAGSLAPLIELAERNTPSDPDQLRAQEALLGLMRGHQYITRLYTRLSPAEMSSDPTFRRTSGGDIDRTRTLPRYVEGRDMCEFDPSTGISDVTTPCDFMACGAGGLCRVVDRDGTLAAGCACVPGATARTTFDPQGRATVACQDMRLSFSNPGDREGPGEEPLPDPCVGFDCGAGSCVSMNMTPTCVCDRGAVAVGSLDPEGMRQTNCVNPLQEVPPSFYEQRLPPLPLELPGGRIVDVPPPLETPVAGGGGGCSAGGTPAPMPLAALGVLGLFLVLRRRR
jgi:uncharacterized protein (TIGR03382 family)